MARISFVWFQIMYKEYIEQTMNWNYNKFFYLWYLEKSKNYEQESSIYILCYILLVGFSAKVIYLPMCLKGFWLDFGLFRPKQKCQGNQWVWIWSWFHKWKSSCSLYILSLAQRADLCLFISLVGWFVFSCEREHTLALNLSFQLFKYQLAKSFIH